MLKPEPPPPHPPPPAEASAATDDEDGDDEDDREALVGRSNGRKLSNNRRRRATAFEVAGIRSRITRRFFRTSKRCVLAVSLPLLAVVFVLIFVFVAPDLRRFFSGATIAPSPVQFSPADRMREAELRALSLLRDQHSALAALANRTLALGSDPQPTSLSNSSDSFNKLRSELINQIRLNKQIQKTLLSPHRIGNATPGGVSSTDDDLLVLDTDICRKVQLPAQRRTIEWNPRKDRFLFAICLSGQMSNHLICLEKHMFFASLLSRVLILPSPKFDYQYDHVLDINHINDCFGRKVVMRFEEFEEMKKGKVHVSQSICYMASPPCYIDDEHIKRLRNVGVSLGKIEAAWPEDAKLKEQRKRVADDIIPKFSTDDEIIAIGDVFYADVEDEWVNQPGGPLAHKCKTVLQPSRLIILTAQRFVQTFLGRNYIALHFRRHGFLKFCNVKQESCFFPIPQAAQCILRVAEAANAPVIYLSTDAGESETNLLQSLLVLNERTVSLVKRPEHAAIEKWDALLFRNHIGGDLQVEAMLDKAICAMSNVFIGASGSTFTDDIFRLRRSWGSASVCDENLCQGELPNYIAELE